jgi:hypothetical protein
VIIDTTYNEIYEDIILFSKNNRWFYRLT